MPTAAMAKQHVDLHRKLALRKGLLNQAPEGAVYVPFCGDGDIATAAYQGRLIYAADIDPARTAVASERLAGATVVTADCDTAWPFPDTDTTFAVADFDAYAYPYDAFRQFWESARKADRLVLFFTDGERQAIKRSGYYHHPSGAKRRLRGDLAAKRGAFNFYWTKEVRPWFEKAIAGWRIVAEQHYPRRDMLHWGVVIERADALPPPKKAKTRSSVAIDPDDLALGADGDAHEDRDLPDWTDEELGLNPLKVGKFSPKKKRRFLELLTQGNSRSMAARAVGVTLRTVEKHQDRFPAFMEAIDYAEMHANHTVVNALFQAAISGNVTAIQVWLYNRMPDEWSDRRKQDVMLTIDDRALGMVADVITRCVTDQETLSRIRAELLRLAAGDAPARSGT